eukprot:UN13165
MRNNNTNRWRPIINRSRIVILNASCVLAVILANTTRTTIQIAKCINIPSNQRRHAIEKSK